jgi:hypothetical protein
VPPEHSSVYEVSGTDPNRVRAPSTAKSVDQDAVKRDADIHSQELTN